MVKRIGVEARNMQRRSPSVVDDVSPARARGSGQRLERPGVPGGLRERGGRAQFSRIFLISQELRQLREGKVPKQVFEGSRTEGILPNATLDQPPPPPHRGPKRGPERGQWNGGRRGPREAPFLHPESPGPLPRRARDAPFLHPESPAPLPRRRARDNRPAFVDAMLSMKA